MPPRVRARILVPRPVAPERWRTSYGWWVALYKPSGERFVRSNLVSREAAIEERDAAMASGAYEKAWIGEHREPSKEKRRVQA